MNRFTRDIKNKHPHFPFGFKIIFGLFQFLVEKGDLYHLLTFNRGASGPKDPVSKMICALSRIKTLEFFIPSHLIYLY